MKVIRVHNKLIKIITFSEDSQWQDVDEESAKGQIISKWFFDVFDFLQKMKENKSTWSIIVVKSYSFIRFLEEMKTSKTLSKLSDLYNWRWKFGLRSNTVCFFFFFYNIDVFVLLK